MIEEEPGMLCSCRFDSPFPGWRLVRLEGGEHPEFRFEICEKCGGTGWSACCEGLQEQPEILRQKK
jgi:hypothetical protein